ncbi:uncharacterized protein LOC119833104 isoform X2 [Zerene cesonia]|uniref:uncharacterized protein LOC119833104 isoform X2 n=1 Tax=Zerene cesonia TaxID=33412 RepID=UPI0018E54570|nr:uncharacterized protein LOC119833104 isoform X2 [Zerene cesonia]
MEDVQAHVSVFPCHQYSDVPSVSTMANLIPQIGTVPKQMVERYAEYPATHDQHFYYTYEPASHSHGHVSPSKYGGGEYKKSNAAMSALTLLAFLFFLHILQQCLKDHMTAMSTPQVMIMSTGKEGDENIGKITRTKTDKSGMRNTAPSKASDIIDRDEHLMKITTSDHEPQGSAQKFKNSYKYNDYGTPGVANAFDKK